MNYYLFDCYGQVVGNPRGYATFRGAAQAERLQRDRLQSRYEQMKETDPTNRLLSRISQGRV